MAKTATEVFAAMCFLQVTQLPGRAVVSNPTSRPRINSLQAILDQSQFGTENLDTLVLFQYRSITYRQASLVIVSLSVPL
jgi:hypothetical protein